MSSSQSKAEAQRETQNQLSIHKGLHALDMITEKSKHKLGANLREQSRRAFVNLVSMDSVVHKGPRKARIWGDLSFCCNST